MIDQAAELRALRKLCPGAELWEEDGQPLVFLPELEVTSGGTVHKVDALLCPRPRNGYESRLFFSERLPVNANWSDQNVMTRTWWVISWQGVTANGPWMGILATHLEAVK